MVAGIAGAIADKAKADFKKDGMKRRLDTMKIVDSVGDCRSVRLWPAEFPQFLG